MEISRSVILTASLPRYARFLGASGEGQDEGMENQAVGLILSPLPNHSRMEREYMGQQCI
jgi:hypothetical protein